MLDVRFTLDETGGDTPAAWRTLNVPFYGLGICEVVASGSSKYPVHALLSANTGYEQYTRLSGVDDPSNEAGIRVLPAHARDESTGVPLSNYISALGMPGLTAFAGLKVLDVQPGKTIFVGSAAGGVGQLVGQLAKQQGLTVIGSGTCHQKESKKLSYQSIPATK
jgi:NADPH-dependent curcumin reductase CurA